jgi:pSer/pThr/pTyr-binding forkhead associated (FHA) protein
MASIIVVSGSQKGEFLPLGKRANVIGRAENLTLQILDNLVSRKHIRIRYGDTTNKYYAEDLKCKHGVLINNRQITCETILSEGDEIVIGDTRWLFTDKDFDNRESALSHYKKVGEKKRTTLNHPERRTNHRSV